jgi:hypothetical protein
MHRKAARPLLALAALLAACGGTPAPPAERPPLVVLIGDSTTAGYTVGDEYVLADASPLVTLAALTPRGSPWHAMDVVSLGVPGTTTHDWAVAGAKCDDSPAVAAGAARWVVMVARACERSEPLVAEVPGLFDRSIALALVTLGTNDPARDPNARPEDAVENLHKIAATLAPTRVLVSSPFWTGDPRRIDFVERLATLLAERGLLTGPDFARMHLPLDHTGVHLTRGGFVAAAALWLDVLPPDAR